MTAPQTPAELRALVGRLLGVVDDLDDLVAERVIRIVAQAQRDADVAKALSVAELDRGADWREGADDVANELYYEPLITGDAPQGSLEPNGE